MARDIGKTLLFVVTEDWYFWWNRLDLARAARDAGFIVHVATSEGQYRKRISDEGFYFHPIRLSRNGRNPLRELVALRRLVSLYRDVHPTLVHHIAMKPVLYGSLAARIAGVPAVVNTFAGLGHAFVTGTILMRTVRWLLVYCLSMVLQYNRSVVIFQNDEDRADFIRYGITTPERSVVIRGSGVDVDRFVPVPESPDSIVLFAGRMLRHKGVGEFVEAARWMRRAGAPARFVLVGIIDEGNPGTVTENEVLSWQREGIIQWCGATDNMPSMLAAAHVVVLPTYYGEGLPKILLEAAACGRPIVTTDTRGCRDIVRHGENGYLIPPRDVTALVDTIDRVINDRALRERMGARGRDIVCAEFSSAIVASQTLRLYWNLLNLPVDEPLAVR